MNITRLGNYIMLKSEEIEQVLDDLINYSSIEITANRNCCGDTVPPSVSLNTGTSTWTVDLSEQVSLGSVITGFSFVSPKGQQSDTYLATIDLGYVEDNCLVGTCTMSDMSVHFIPLFKTAIDTMFNQHTTGSNVTVTLNGNVLNVTNLPIDYFPEKIFSGEDMQLFKYNGANPNTFIGSDAIYVTPTFFGDEAITDGIYEFGVKYRKTSGSFVIESSCAFIDVITKCEVAAYLKGIIDQDEVSTNVHIMHYALTNGSNCGCNCIELCKIYETLYKTIYDKYPKIGDCGCQM